MPQHTARGLAILAALVLSAAMAHAGTRYERLFVIGRSKNANIVAYDAAIAPSRRLDRDRPVRAYWVMLAEDGHREGLSWMERRLAYGIDSTFAGGHWVLRLKAFDERPIHVRRRDGRFRAEVEIDGRMAWLQRIFVQAREGTVLPKVRFIDLTGIDPDTREPVRERLVPSRQ